MTPRTISGLDSVAYHAAAGLVANGAAALAAAGTELLAKGGVPRDVASAHARTACFAASPTTSSVSGSPALSPARCAAATPRACGATSRSSPSRAPELVPLYRALVLAQIPMARELGDADPAAFDAIEATLRGCAETSFARRAGSPRARRE